MAKEKLERTNLVPDRTHELAIFQAMAENAVDGMALSTLEGVITYANPADHVLFGYDPERREMVGLPLLRFFSEDSLKVLSEEAIPQALDGTSWQSEVRGIRKDGTRSDLLMTVFAIRDERGDPIALAAVLRDITERKRAEEALRESAERLKILLDSTPSGIVVIDAETHVIVAANPVATEMIGVSPEQVIGSVCHNYICPAEKGRCPITDLGQTVDNSERVLLNADGRSVPILKTVTPVMLDGREHLLESFNDITERKQTEEALQQREAVLRAIALAAEKFLRPSDWEQDIQAVLAYLGKAADVSRVLIWEGSTSEDGKYLISWRHEWLAPEAKLAPLQGQQNVPVFRRWRDFLPRGEIIAGHVRDFSAKEQEFFVPRGIKSVLSVPIFVNGVWWGFMGFDQGGTEREWTEAEIDTLKTAASILGGALERKRAEEMLERRTTQLQVAAEVSRAASSILEPDELIQQMVDLVCGRFDLYYAGLFLMDQTGEWTGEPGKWAVLRAGTGEAGRKMVEQGHKLEVGGESMIGWCVVNKQARIAQDVGEEAVRFENPLLPETRSELALPLISRGRVIGAMTIQSTQPAAFSEEDITALQTMADQLANAIENVRLFESQTKRATQLTLVNEVGRTLTSILDVDTLLGQVVQLIRDTFDYYQVNLGLIEGDALVPKAWAGALSTFPTEIARLNLDAEAIVTRVVTSGTSLLVPDVRREPLFLPLPGLEEVRSELAVPLRSKDQIIGVLDVESDRLAAFDERDLTVLEALAGQIAVAIENARLFEETRANLEKTTFLHRRYLQEAWSEFLEEETGQERAGYMYDRGIVSPASAVWRPEIGLAVQRGDTIALSDMADALQGTVEEVGMILQTSPAQSALAVPLKVRGQVIGALDFYETDQARDWSSEEIAMIETVANQVALAIENARAYEELQKTAEQLRELDRLKTQFLANMSHELRTPLNSIIGFSRVILKGIDGPITEQQRADLTSIYNNGQHLLGMINDILDISKIEASKMELIFEPVDMQRIISGVISTAAALVEDKPIELKQEVNPNLPVIRADGTRVRQVILNLLSNAAKFTEKGQIILGARADEDQITISVKDTGIGISPEHQVTIFEEFRQVDASTTRRTGGTGLGLAISRQFVEMHGGRIWVESEPGVGSIFTFTLPIIGPAPIAESELAALTIDPSRKLILAVEDDEGATAIYKRYLEKQGYQVVGLNQGKQAVRWATELSPYAIILDVLLSDEDGWVVLEELKSSRETRQIPIIICTIVDDEEARGLSLGATDYLVKPILEEDLLQSLQRLEERQRI